jgi:hypothetical protein
MAAEVVRLGVHVYCAVPSYRTGRAQFAQTAGTLQSFRTDGIVQGPSGLGGDLRPLSACPLSADILLLQGRFPLKVPA